MTTSERGLAVHVSTLDVVGRIYYALCKSLESDIFGQDDEIP